MKVIRRSQKTKNHLKSKHQKIDALVHVIADIQILFLFHSPMTLIALNSFPWRLFVKIPARMNDCFLLQSLNAVVRVNPSTYILDLFCFSVIL